MAAVGDGELLPFAMRAVGDGELLPFAVAFFLVASIVSVVTVVLRRRSGRQDLLRGQMREMQARTARSPEADTRLWDAATRAADARVHEALSRDAASAPDSSSPDSSSPGAPAPGAPAPGVPAPGVPAPGVPAPGVPAPGVPAPGVPSPGVPSPGVQVPGVPDPVGFAPGAGFPDAVTGDRPGRDATTPPDGWPLAPGATNDAMADAFAWLQIVALVEAGQREEAVARVGATMGISEDEAAMLVDGLLEAGQNRRTGLPPAPGDMSLPPASGDAGLPPASGDAGLPPASGDAGLPPAPEDTGAAAGAVDWVEIARLAAQGRRMQAVELVRTTAGVSLSEAIGLVDRLSSAGVQRPGDVPPR